MAFDPNNCHISYKLNTNNKHVTMNMHKGGQVYLVNIARSGVHKWKFKITNMQKKNIYMTIGIWKANNKLDTKERLWSKAKDKGYGWVINAQRLHNSNDKWGRLCWTGDIVEMILDLNTGTLSYSVNDMNQGVAFKNIQTTEGLFGYVAVVSMNNIGDSIEIISYSNDNVYEGNYDVMEDVKCNNCEELRERNKRVIQQNDELMSEMSVQEAIINSLNEQIESLSTTYCLHC